MPLNPALLQSAFYRLSTTEKPGSPMEAAQKIASAYEQYASTALAGPGLLVAPGPGRAVMEQPLAAAFSVLPGLPPVVAAGYAAMVTSFWAAASFVSPAGPGIAAPPAGVGALIPALTAFFSVPGNPVELYSLQVATVLDACTRTVLVTYVLPPPAPPLIVPVT